MNKKVAGILGLFIVWPIWYFLLYRILEAVNAAELTWFLYWVYIPASILASVLVQLVEKK